MPSLLVEIGCEELPAAACNEAEAQLRDHVRAALGLEPTQVFVSPRRVAFLVEDAPGESASSWVSGPPASAPDTAKEGFARKYGVTPDSLEERDGRLGVELPGRPLAEVVKEQLDELVYGLTFSKSMRWGDDGRRFSRPVRWVLVKLDGETIAGESSFGRRFISGAVDMPTASAYPEALRAAGVEPDQNERRRRIVEGLDELGTAEDPLGKLDEVVQMSEWPVVLEATFDETFLRLPRRVIDTAMQLHQRYFPLGGNRFALVTAGGEPELTVPGYVRVLEGRLDDAAFTFDRDVAVGIGEMAGKLGQITFFEGGATLAEKTERLVELVEKLGGGEDARQAARLAKADQASELVREFPTLEGAIGAEYARLAGSPDGVCTAIAEHYLPDGVRRRPPDDGRGPDRSPRRTRSTRWPSRSASVIVRPARATRMACAARRSASAGSPSRAASRSRGRCSTMTCATSSRSDSRATSTSPWNSSARRARPVSLISAPSPSSRPGSRVRSSRPCTRSTSARAASSGRRPTSSRSTTPCSPMRQSASSLRRSVASRARTRAMTTSSRGRRPSPRLSSASSQTSS